ncbi:hypothetical protein AMECASPLE_014076 [Ameca splendens]|uniref:Uncharacterized protein n=1 Tax=Ameca splendens TaxID=208324 RepID=A0ABV0Y1R1_9TELE
MREKVRETEAEREKEREPFCCSATCFFNPDSALKYGHHVHPLKSHNSAVGSASQERLRCPGGGMWGGSRSQSRRGRFKECVQRRRVIAEEPHLKENRIAYRPMETGVSEVTPAGWLKKNDFNTM